MADGFVSPRIPQSVQNSGHRLHVKGRWRKAAGFHVPEWAGEPAEMPGGQRERHRRARRGAGARDVPEPRRAARAAAPQALPPPRVPQRWPRAAGRPRGAGGAEGAGRAARGPAPASPRGDLGRAARPSPPSARSDTHPSRPPLYFYSFLKKLLLFYLFILASERV